MKSIEHEWVEAMNWIRETVWLRVKNFGMHSPERSLCLVIFVLSLAVYLLNQQTITSNDNIPTSLLSLNWLEHHTLHLDAFRGGHFYGPNGRCPNCIDGTPYFFTEAPNGYLTTTYPIGTSIVTFPIYALLFVVLKGLSILQTLMSGVPSSLLDLTGPNFERYREPYEKLVAAIATAITIVLFYLLTRLKFDRPVALLTTFTFAFATLIWVIAAQGLRQHTATVLVLTALILALFKANRVAGRERAVLLIVSGILCGLLPGIRPTNLLFVLTVGLYAIATYGKDSRFFLMGLPSALLAMGWNVYFFGFSPSNLLTAGYSRLLNHGAGSYHFTLSAFWHGFWGQLISPSRGLLVYSPVLLFALPGAYQVIKLRSEKDERLIAALLLACGVLFLQYCFYVPWWGAVSYGSRFLTDVLPILGFLLAFFIARHFLPLQPSRLSRSLSMLFLLCLIFSTGVQIVGAFSQPRLWEPVPYWRVERLWDWHDGPIVRHGRNLLSRIHRPIEDPSRYLQQLSGTIERVDRGDRPALNHLVAPAGRGQMLTAIVQNTGSDRWYGYETGMVQGRAQVRVRVMDGNQRAIATSFLYVSGNPAPGEQAEAIGMVRVPQQTGDYQLVFDLMVVGLGRMPNQPPRPYELPLRVVPRAN